MASDAVIEFTDDNFDREVIQSDLPVLVDFWADWCMPCKAMAPIIDQLADEFTGRVKVGKVDTDANRNTALKLEINAIPTIILFKGGEAVQRFVGVKSKNEFASELERIAV